MQWLAENWVWVVIGVLFIGAHMFGHGGHGGHGGHDDESRRAPDGGDDDGTRKSARATDRPGHRH